MGLSNLPEWARNKPDDDPLEAEVRKQVEQISATIDGISDKTFTAAKEGERVVVSMHRSGENAVADTSLFTVSQVDNDEYLVMDAGAAPNERPIFVGSLSETMESVRNEILYTYLESWERPDLSATSSPDDDIPGLTDEELERLFNLPDDPPPPPGLN